MKILPKITLQFLLVLLLPILLFSQNEKIQFKKIGIEDGLPQNQIYSMTQGQDGYIWICTSFGLGKYNGSNFENYYHNKKDSTSIPAHLIYKYFEDSKGRSYVGTYNGFAEFNKQKGTFTTYRHIENKNSISGNSVNDIVELDNGLLALATHKGIDIFNPETKTFTHYKHKMFKASTFTPSLLYDSNKQLWAGTTNGLYKLLETENKLIHFPLISPEGIDLIIFHLFQDSEQTIWVATNAGLYTFNPIIEKFNRIEYDSKNKFTIVKAIVEYPKGNLYIGTRNGLFHWNIKNNKLLKQYQYAADNPEGISINDIFSLMKDRDNNIWIGLYRGLNIINPEKEMFKLFYNRTGLNNPKNCVFEMLSDSKGRVWTNTIEGLFVKNRIQQNITEIDFPGLKKNIYKMISQIIEDRNGDIWIFFYYGEIYKTTNQTLQFVQVETTNYFNESRIKNVITDIFTSEIFWLATTKGLCKYNSTTRDTSWIKPNKNDSSKSNNIFALTQHKNGDIWFISNKSLCNYNFKTESIKYYNTNKKDSVQWNSNGIYDLVATEDRIYMSGYSFTYFDINNKKFVKNNKYNPPVNLNKIKSLLKAVNGNIWLVNEESVLEYFPQTNTIKKYKINYKSGGFIAGSKSINSNGKLLFGAYNGVLEINPTNLKTNKAPPKVILSNFKVSNKIKKFNIETQFIKKVYLKPKENIFSIEFNALQFINEDILKYKYKLEGFDENWVHANNSHEATYTNLNPGNYTFIAQAINEQGLESETPLILDIYIEPHFWQTNFFYTLLLLSISTILYLIYLNRKKVRKLNEAKLVAEQNAIYKSKFLANMSHEFRTPMNAIMGLNKLMLTSELTEKQQEYAKGIDLSCENLLWIINDILDQSKIESGKMTIRKKPFNIKDVLDQISLLLRIKIEEKGLDFNINIDSKTPKSLIGDPTRVFQILTNLVGNAIKFTEKGNIDLNIKLKDNNSQSATLLFEVKDTGIGIPTHKIDEIFKSFEQVYSEKNNKYYSEGTGLGLSISKELVEQMGGTIHLKSEEGKGSNFFFDLTFEISNEKFSPKEKIKELTLPENLRILLVEDTPINRFLAIELLKQHLKNVIIEIAENGKIATEKIKRKNFDLILMDIKMPVMDGLEATKLIRNMSGDYFKTVPILGLSANAIPQQIQEAKDMGMNACITKPIYLPELLNSISILTK